MIQEEITDKEEQASKVIAYLKFQNFVQKPAKQYQILV